MNSVMPKMEPFVVGEATVYRKGIYAAVLEKLMYLAKLDPPQGSWVAFPSASASNGAIKKMNTWAFEDGYRVVYHAWDGTGRRLHVEPLPAEGAK